MNLLGILFIAASIAPAVLNAQERFATRTGHISFFSETSMENIEAHNYKVASVFDAGTNAVEMSLLMKAFEFDKALMQEHFNENYVESDKFPKAMFKGKVNGLPEGALNKPGTYDVAVAGDLTMHGVTKPVSTKGTLTVDPTGVLKAAADFSVVPEDFGIKIPGAVRDNIAEQILIMVRVDYQKM